MMSDVALTLGPVLFAGFEVPARIGFGGSQALAVHDLPGGGRVIDAMGPRPADIAWSGIFAGPDATLRARALDTLRAQGSVLALSWDVFFHSVVIEHFAAQYHTTAWVPYTLRVRVLADPAAPGTIDTLLSDLSEDASAALGFAQVAGIALPTDVVAAQGVVQAAQGVAGARLAGFVGGIGTAGIAPMIAAAGQAANLAAAGAYLGRAVANAGNA